MIDGISRSPAGSVPPAGPPLGEKDMALLKTARDLEGLFVQQLFKAMRETVPEGEGIVSGGSGEDIFTGLLDEHLAAETPGRWESGVAAALYRQLRGIQGSDATSPAPSAPAAPLVPAPAPRTTNSSTSAI
jgi:flagellar protein FlgJ